MPKKEINTNSSMLSNITQNSRSRQYAPYKVKDNSYTNNDLSMKTDISRQDQEEVSTNRSRGVSMIVKYK